MDPLTLLPLMVATVLGAFVQSVTGFGFALIAAPTFIDVIGSAEAVATLLAVQLLHGMTVVPRIWRLAPRELLTPLIAGSIVGIPLGLVVLSRLDLPMLKLAIGLAMIAFVVLMILQEAGWLTWGITAGRTGVAHNSWVVGLVGLSAGLMAAERLALRTTVEGFTYPAVIYAPAPGTPPLSVDELGQLFADFNFRVAQVPQHIALALDRSDIFIQLAERLAASSLTIVEHGGMEKRVSTLGKQATGIVTRPVLLRFVRGACEGEDLQESNKAFSATPNLDGKRFEDVAERLAEFIDAFANEMGDAFGDRTSLHLTSSGLQAIGLIYHDVVYRLHGTDFLKVARSLGRLDWSKTGELWSNIVTEKELKVGKVLVLRQHGSSAKREIVRILRHWLGIDRRLAELAKAA